MVGGTDVDVFGLDVLLANGTQGGLGQIKSWRMRCWVRGVEQVGGDVGTDVFSGSIHGLAVDALKTFGFCPPFCRLFLNLEEFESLSLPILHLFTHSVLASSHAQRKGIHPERMERLFDFGLENVNQMFGHACFGTV